MSREGQLLKLLDALMDGVFSGAVASRPKVRENAAETILCARDLSMARTEALARDLVAILDREPDSVGDWTQQVEARAEVLHVAAEQELEVLLGGGESLGSDPAAPGMPWGDFVLEARDHLQNIEQDLLRLERVPGDSEAIHSLFRGFHTIKGLAAIAGVETAREVAHQTENLLDSVRSGERPVTSSLVDLVLEAADFLSQVVDAAEKLDAGHTATIPEDAQDLLDKLTIAIDSPAEAEPEYAAPADPVAATGEFGEDNDLVIETGAGVSVSQPKRQAAAKAQAGRPAGERGRSSVKVDTSKLDQLVDLVGELVIAQSLVQLDPALHAVADTKTAKNLNQLGRITTELQKTAMALRVVPVGQTFQRMSRVFRDLVRESGKKAVLETSGEDAELDRTIVEQLADPLMHMIRNAVDHGLERPEDREKAGKPAQGTLRLSASHQSGYVVIEVSDDGRGLDGERILRKAVERGLVKEQNQLSPTEILELIFEPGFSTSEKVTAISGRGVGMDVVKREIEKLRGRVEVRSEPGKGTTFLLRVPLTLAIIDALVVKQSGDRFILPLFTVREILKPGGQVISTVEGRNEVAVVRDRVLPILRLESMLAQNSELARTTEESVLVVVESGGKQVAVAVDEVVGKQEVVIKSLGDWLGRIRGVAGGAILGDGSVGIILDLDGLMGREGYGLAA